jgi:hypothetical protein
MAAKCSFVSVLRHALSIHLCGADVKAVCTYCIGTFKCISNMDIKPSAKHCSAGNMRRLFMHEQFGKHCDARFWTTKAGHRGNALSESLIIVSKSSKRTQQTSL